MKVLKQIEEEKGLSEEIIVASLEAAMVSAYKKYKGGNQTAEVHIDVDSGDFASVGSGSSFLTRLPMNPSWKISIAEAKRRGNDDVDEDSRKEFSPNFRIAAQTARQVIIQRLKDAERQVI